MIKALSPPLPRASRPSRAALAALSLLVVVLLAGCADGGSQPFEPTGEVTAREGAGFGAAELRAELTEALVDHPYLLGAQMIAEAEAEGGGEESNGKPATAGPGNAAGPSDAPEPKDADESPEPTPALDRSSVALADVLGEAYGDDFRDDLLAEWRGLTRDQLALARAARANEAPALRAISTQTADHRLEIGRLLEEANENLTAKGIARELASITELTGNAARRIAAGRSVALESLREAARSGSTVAEVLATATANQLPERYRGRADSPAAALRSELGGALESHAYLLGLRLLAGGDPSQTSGLSSTDRNSIAIRALFMDAYGKDSGRIFLPGWRRHTDQLVDHWVAAREGDPEAAATISAELDEYRARLARLVSRSDPGISVERVSELLRPYFTATLEMTEVLAGESSVATSSEAIGRAAATMEPLAEELADSVIQSNPERFPAEDG